MTVREKKYQAVLIEMEKIASARIGKRKRSPLGAIPDTADFAARVFEREMAGGLRQQQETILRDIQAALHRLDHGEFGVCIACGADIPERRLEAHPYGERCVGCQTDAEQR